ncbi:MAG: TonB-dependent receptor [Acidobacteriota bacterium]
MKFIMKVLYAVLLGTCVALIPGQINAQSSTTGTVEGIVSDPNGAAVPSATVSISGGGLLREQTATSDQNGNFRFLQLPPGRYTVKVVSAAGFEDYKLDDIEVNLSKSTTLNVALKPKGVGATVDVTANPEVDISSNTSGTNVSTEFFSNIPTQRTVQGLYTIAPTVTRSGLRDASGRDRDPSVGGSSGPENNYILDGVNTTDPAFGGGGANLPFEFVQEVEIKTGSYGADQGLSTGGVFNVITKSGGNEFHGDLFGYFSDKKLVRETRNLPFTDLAPNGFSELDAGGDIGGPIIKNRLTFFAAFNPQYRKNFYLTQTLRTPVSGKISTPFYAGKLTWSANNNNTLTFSTFSDFTKEKGHLFAANNTGDSGFGVDEAAFQGTIETGGTNYAARLNSVLSKNWIGEFAFGIHRQRSNVIPATPLDIPLITDNFAILKADGTIASVTQTAVQGPTNTGFVDFVYSPNGSLQRNFIRNEGFGLYQDQNRNRWEASARMQNIFSNHTFKYGFEFYRNMYDINQLSSGPGVTFTNPLGVGANNGTDADNRSVNGFRVTNNFSVCTTRGSQIVCPNQSALDVLNSAAAANTLPNGLTVNQTTSPLTAAETNNNPFLVRTTTRVRDFQLHAQTATNVEGFYVQDDWRVSRNVQFNVGVRWDYQQILGNEGVTYIKFNNWFDNLQPRLGFIWDFTKTGKGKVFANYARYLEAPLPLDVNVRAGSLNTQTDKNFNVNRYGAPSGSTVATGFNTRNLGAAPTPPDPGLKPQTVNEFNLGFEYQFRNNLTLGVRGIYRAQGSVIEDGSFDNGNTYLLFNPGEPIPPGRVGPIGNSEFIAGLPACFDSNGDGNQANEAGFGISCGGIGAHFGRARRFYRAIEVTLNRRFADKFSYTTSYVFSSLIGNYEGLFRNDNGQADPNITSLFDLVSLLANTYGRLPNDRPHQFKFNGTYETPFKLVVSGNFYVQSGIPVNQLIPDPSGAYGNNEGFGVPRGTAIIAPAADLVRSFSGLSGAIGKSRTPTTWNLDVGVYYPIKFSERTQLRFTADWFNVTNTQRAIKIDETFETTLNLAGVPNVRNPFYGTGLIFQYPSSIRLGAKFSF